MDQAASFRDIFFGTITIASLCAVHQHLIIANNNVQIILPVAQITSGFLKINIMINISWYLTERALTC